ncbi:hypothetical protein FRC05_002260 [Tulasnella sp. 425]|nr:hypothetical protein FRC05_002260 [Tulasnella sp. 425]
MDENLSGNASFRGEDGKEAEEFIQAVRKAAFDANKDRDNEWMARFASTCMSGKALRWYESLDDDVQESWRRLKKAILVSYPPAREDSIIPSPSAAPAAPAAAFPPAAPETPSFPQVYIAPPPQSNTRKPPAGKPPAGKPPAGKPPPGKKPPAGKPPAEKPPSGKKPPAGKPPAGKPPAEMPPSGKKPPAGKAPAGKAPAGKKPPAGKPPAGASPQAAAQRASSFPADLNPVTPAPSGSSSSKPSNNPFAGARGIIEIRYTETNKFMGHISRTLRGNGAAQVTRSGRNSGQAQQVYVKKEPSSIHFNIGLATGFIGHTQSLGLTWVHQKSARAPAGYRYAAAVFMEGSDGSSSSINSNAYEGISEAAIWDIAPNGKMTATSDGKYLAFYVFEETNQINVFPDFNSYVASRGVAQQWDRVAPIVQVMDIAIEDLAGAFAVPPPFNDASPGDCYLQSLEGVRFKVLRHVLTNSSRYFERLFEDLPPSAPGDLPKLLMDEDARTLHALLILLYPVHAKISSINIAQTIKLLEIRDKYDITDNAILFILGGVVGTNITGDGLVDDPMGLYSLSWRFGFQPEVQLFSRYLHGIDLNDEDLVNRLIHHAGSVKAYIALSDLHRRREAALDNIIEALEPRKHFCSAHSASDTMFFAFISLIKNAARTALLSPVPKVGQGGAISFLGLQSEDEMRAVTWCSTCYAGADKTKLSSRLQAAIDKYPQEIKIVPGYDTRAAWH